MNWLYLAINLGSIAVPLAFSFEKRARFYKSWPSLFPALLITALVFIVWDVWFTSIGIWRFNPEYISGIYLLNLPVEEWMFFLFIPYSCVFIHESLKQLLPGSPMKNYGKPIAILLGICSIAIGLINLQHMYTAVTFLAIGTFLLFTVRFSSPQFMGRFFLTYLVSLIPFTVVNGILTGMPVLIYNANENIGIRIGTIPLEDFFYSMLMLLMNITIFEYLQTKRNSTDAAKRAPATAPDLK